MPTISLSTLAPRALLLGRALIDLPQPEKQTFFPLGVSLKSILDEKMAKTAEELSCDGPITNRTGILKKIVTCGNPERERRLALSDRIELPAQIEDFNQNYELLNKINDSAQVDQ